MLKPGLVLATCALVGLAGCGGSSPSGPSESGGASITVGITAPCDYSTIADGLSNASAGDTVKVACGYYYESLVMTPGVKLLGGFSEDFTSRDPGDYVTYIVPPDRMRCMRCILGGGTSTVIDGFHFRHGFTEGDLPDGVAGAILCEGSSPTISNNAFTASEAYAGGAIGCIDSSARIRDNRFSMNYAGWMGGAVYCSGGSPQITGNMFVANTSSLGGAISCDNATSATIYGNVFGWSESYGSGGCIYVRESAAPSITANVIISSLAGGSGGAVYFESGTSGLLSDNTIAANSASGKGGGVFVEEASPTISFNLIYWNKTEEEGGGISCLRATPLIENNTIDLNYSPLHGGGIAARSAPYPTIRRNIVTRSTRGEGIYSFGTGPVLEENDVWGNAGGSYYGCGADPASFSLDPTFCDPDQEGYDLIEGSPCSPEQAAGGELIGARPVGCEQM